MKKFFITFVSAFAVLVVVSAVSCVRQDNTQQEIQQPQELNEAVIDMCINNMTGLVGDLVEIGNRVKDGTRSMQDAESQANFLVDQLGAETRIFLEEQGWTDDDFEEMDEVVGIEEAYAWFATMLVAENGGFSDGIPPVEDFIGDNPVIQQALTWTEVGVCAAAVLGADVLSNLRQNAGEKITKAVIKLAFKTTAKALLGPVGLIWAIGEFAVCIGIASLD